MMMNRIVSESCNQLLTLTIERDGRPLEIKIVPETVAYSMPLLVINSSTLKNAKFLPVTHDRNALFCKDFTKARVQFSLFSFLSSSSNEPQDLSYGDELVSIDQNNIYSFETAISLLSTASEGCILTLDRNHERINYIVPGNITASIEMPLNASMLGCEIQNQSTTIHLTPLRQIKDHIMMTLQVLSSMISRNSDINLQHLTGPPGIARTLHAFSSHDVRLVICFAVLLNINLAIMNLLPIPVLDGGHILFALISKIRGQALPLKIIANTQILFVLLLFSLMIYISFLDICRWRGDYDLEKHVKQENQYYVDPIFEELKKY